MTNVELISVALILLLLIAGEPIGIFIISLINKKKYEERD